MYCYVNLEEQTLIFLQTYLENTNANITSPVRNPHELINCNPHELINCNPHELINCNPHELINCNPHELINCNPHDLHAPHDPFAPL